MPAEPESSVSYAHKDEPGKLAAGDSEIADIAKETAARKTQAARPSQPIEPPPSDLPFDRVSGFSPDGTAGASGSDTLRIGADARALARLMCLEGAAPLAIAVLGGWGSGKSTFMERLDLEVRKIVRPKAPADEAANPKEARMIERVVQVRFNAWQFVDANLWASLTAEFFDQLRAGGWDRSQTLDTPALLSG